MFPTDTQLKERPTDENILAYRSTVQHIRFSVNASWVEVRLHVHGLRRAALWCVSLMFTYGAWLLLFNLMHKTLHLLFWEGQAIFISICNFTSNGNQCNETSWVNWTPIGEKSDPLAWIAIILIIKNFVVSFFLPFYCRVLHVSPFGLWRDPSSYFDLELSCLLIWLPSFGK